MKKQRDFSGLLTLGWVAAGVLLAAYFVFVWLLVEADFLRQALLCFGAAFAALAVVLLVVLRRRVVAFTTALDHDLDDLLAGRTPRAAAQSTETLLGRLQNKLLRIQDILRAEAARNEAEKKAVQSLVSDISHQVKTPIANIRMYGEILQTRKPTGEQAEEFLAHIVAQTDRLGFLTGSMVKLSRLETGVVQLHKKTASLYQMLAGVVKALEPEAQRKGIALSLECDEGLFAPFDERWTAEAVHNLVDNAIKYTPEGGAVGLRVERWEMYVHIEVRDNGPGIPEGEQAAVFSRFYRGAEATGAAGVGIGLYLARELVTRQGGYILLRSAPGEGSVFSVFLPCT